MPLQWCQCLFGYFLSQLFLSRYYRNYTVHIELIILLFLFISITLLFLLLILPLLIILRNNHIPQTPLRQHIPRQLTLRHTHYLTVSQHYSLHRVVVLFSDLSDQKCDVNLLLGCLWLNVLDLVEVNVTIIVLLILLLLLLCVRR